jgi:erlin
LQEVYIDKFDTLDEQLAEALQRDANTWAPGIQIIAIRVTKPIIPEKLMKNYEEIESQRTKLHIAQQETIVKQQGKSIKLTG